jgi:hypothetical protein
LARPVADSPEYTGPRFIIEIPDPNKPPITWILHKISMTEEDHEKHLKGMLAHGLGVYRTSQY